MRRSQHSRWTIRCLGALMLLGAQSATVSASGFESAYTHHDYGKCAQHPSPQPDVIDVRACEGFNGIAVIWTGEPDASSVDFGAVNNHESLGMGSFFQASDVIEWRGPVDRGSLKPVAAIVRYRTGPSIGRMNSTRLLIYRVSAGKPSCVMAVVKGAKANEIARALVDRFAKTFVCGLSPRTVRQ